MSEERGERRPTTEQVRSKYATVLDEQAGWKWSDAWASDFDRWLKRERAERDPHTTSDEEMT
jgi:hypothetical protein